MTTDLLRPRRHGRHATGSSRVGRRGRGRADRGRRAGPRRRSRRPRGEVVDATGCWSCRASSTSTRTPASPATRRPTGSSRTRWPRRSAARRRSSRSTTPAPGSSAAATRSLRTGLREWLAATAGDSAVDVGLSAVISASHADAVAEIPHLVDGGVPTFKAFMVYDFGVDDATLLALLGAAADAGGMLEVHCENRTILEALTARHLAAGETGPAFHATSRPPYVEAEATRPGDRAGRGRRGAAVRRPPLLGRRARGGARGAAPPAGPCSPRPAPTT